MFFLFVNRLKQIDLQDYFRSETSLKWLYIIQFRRIIKKAIPELDESFVVLNYWKIHDEVLSLPISPVLMMDEVSFIIAVLNKY
jgi:hypothetical protein